MRQVRRQLVLVLLTFLLVTTVVPATAEFNSTNRITNYESRIENYPVTLLEQGKQLYDAGRFAEAVQVWEQALKAFEQKRDRHHQAISYNYLAIVYQDLGQWEASRSAIASVFKLLQTNHDPLLYAQALNTQGSFQLNTGHADAALSTWKQATQSYRSLKDITGIVLSQINSAQALQTLGLYRQARTTLEQVNQDLAALPNSLLKARELRSLGVTLQVVGDLQQSQAVLSQSLAIAKQLNSTPDIGETLLRLGNTARAMADWDGALKFYQQTTNTATNPHTQLQAQLNQLNILVNTKQTTAALALLPQIQARLANLPPSRTVIYEQVNFSESLMKLSSIISHSSLAIDKRQLTKDKGQIINDIAQMLAKSVRHARELNDTRAESYALGQLGHLYEQNQQLSDALSLTQQALSLAQSIRAADIAANWYWQQGRILKAQGNVKSAIAAYDQAVYTLSSLRQDLVTVNPDVQFSFREQVEPVYRQLVELLLQNVDSLPEPTRQQHLQRSREAIEGLQLAEVENFLREACITYKSRQIDAIDKKAAVIYPILLSQRLEVIVSLSGQPLRHYGTELSAEKASRVFEELRSSLNPVFQAKELLPQAQQIYDWLLRPAKAELERQGIKTLVFVLDGFLRSLPMAVLHDGTQYLIERYNIALTPSLQLLDSPSPSLCTEKTCRLSTLAAGLTEARQGFSALPGVEQEIKQVSATFPSKVLLNQNFTRPNFQQRVEDKPFSVIHLATHGQFSSKAEDTFLLTWDGYINVKEMDRLLREQGEKATRTFIKREPIELLVLSACQTAKGDDRATLGLAGVAVRSGARSTVATLWSVQDKSTSQLISEFYHLLTQPGMTKAEALRRAQLSLLNSQEYNHPYYWSPFVLVGNWQ